MDRTSRLSRLLGYLQHDPANLSILADAANAALDEDALRQAADLLNRYRAQAELPPALLNLSGIVAMRRGERGEARLAFESLLAAGYDDPSVRFNLAWLNALDERFREIGPLIDDAVIAAVPRAAALKVQALHHLGHIDDAIAQGRALLEVIPQDDALLGAVAVAAMDADDHVLASALANRAQSGADALTTRGLFALNDDAVETALDLFDRALAEQPEAPRAWLGRGLGLLAQGDADAAAPALERGAAIWGDHLGSWIAAGWAQFIRGDLSAARRHFETALGHDDNFAESHGALAVIEIAQGERERARQRVEIALRLDRNCFSGMLARALLLEAEGSPEAAQRIVERAMMLPAGIDGRTLAQALTGLGMTSGRKGGTQ